MYTNIDKMRTAAEGALSRMVALLVLVTPFALWKVADIIYWLFTHVTVRLS